MGNTAKIIFLQPKSPVTYSDNPCKQTESPINNEIFFEELFTIFSKAQNMTKKIEDEWELDHNEPTIRDGLHLMHFYLKAMQKLLKDIKNRSF